MRNISIDEMKSLQVEIMQAIHDFCKTNDIKYTFAFGSLIGAVRHKGIIPWDDDIDVVMLREDYEKFDATFSHPYYKVYDYRKDENYVNYYAKVSDERTLLIENVDSLNLGINIDIFPLDDMGDTEEECLTLIKKLRIWKLLFRIKYVRVDSNQKMKKFALNFMKFILKPLSMKTITEKEMSIVLKQKKDNAKFVGIPAGYETPKENTIEKSVFENYVELDFENRKMMAIKDYDKWLKQIYGDYMQIPPEEKRCSPHSLGNVYWRD